MSKRIDRRRSPEYRASQQAAGFEHWAKVRRDKKIEEALTFCSINGGPSDYLSSLHPRNWYKMISLV